MEAIAACTASDALKLCLRFIILTAVRSGEARGATWSEMDLQAAEWRIPEERMKGGCEHRVPLSAAAMDTLERARKLHSPAGWCFPAPTRASKQMHADVVGACRADDLRGPLHGARLPLVVPGLGERADQRAARRRGGGAGASGRKRRREVLRPVGPFRQAPWPDGPMGRVRDVADVVTFSRQVAFVRRAPAFRRARLPGRGRFRQGSSAGPHCSLRRMRAPPSSGSRPGRSATARSASTPVSTPTSRRSGSAPEDLPVHSFRTLLTDLGTLTRQHHAGGRQRRHLRAAHRAHAGTATLLRAAGSDPQM